MRAIHVKRNEQTDAKLQVLLSFTFYYHLVAAPPPPPPKLSQLLYTVAFARDETKNIHTKTTQ